MSKIDPQLPPSFVRNFLEANPGYRTGMNEEADALFNPSISAKPLHVPIAMRIKNVLNSDVWFYWAFDRCGQHPYHTRCEQLRAAGFEYASTKDAEMFVDDVVKGKNQEGFSNEIRNGDNRLMKVKKSRWMEIRKSHLIQAIMMANPRGKTMGDDGTIMGINAMIPKVKTEVFENPEGILRTPAAVSIAAQDIAALNEGKLPSGNASRVSKESVNRGAATRPSAGRGSE
jgi:hypothetical protein